MEEPEAPGQHQAAQQPPPPRQGRAPALPQAVPAEQAVPHLAPINFIGLRALLDGTSSAFRVIEAMAPGRCIHIQSAYFVHNFVIIMS